MFESDLKHRNSPLGEKLRRLYTLKGGGGKIELTLRAPYLELLQKFCNPHEKLPPVIHVAGTNGKGSVIATLQAILETAGYKVHAYTSPHLCAFNERITLAGEFIMDGALEALVDEALILNNNNETTFFEITTAMAFAAFARTPADILLLETGLGGRLDCTNVIDKPLATIISSIGLDHVEYLGDTIEKIAAEKAGIMKRGIPCILAKQTDKAVTDVFESMSRALDAPLHRAGAQWSSEAKKDRLHFVSKSVTPSVEKTLPLPNLKGLHQVANAGAALAALEVIKDRFPVSDDALARGLHTIRWPARLQDITAAFQDILPPGWELWLDGAHNEDAARVLSTQARIWYEQDGKKLHLVLGMMDHKKPGTFVQPLRPYLESISLTNIPGEPRAFSAEKMAGMLQTSGIPLSCHGDFLESIEKAVSGAKTPGRILITGSLYLAGHVLNSCAGRAHNREQETLTHAA